MAKSKPATSTSLRFVFRFFLFCKQFDDPGSRRRHLVPALGENVLVARHADRRIFQIGQAGSQSEDFRDLRIIEITQYPTHIVRRCRTPSAIEGLIAHACFLPLRTKHSNESSALQVAIGKDRDVGKDCMADEQPAPFEHCQQGAASLQALVACWL
jgi:hypothetical protein